MAYWVCGSGKSTVRKKIVPDGLNHATVAEGCPVRIMSLVAMTWQLLQSTHVQELRIQDVVPF